MSNGLVIPTTEAARLLGVTPSGVSRMVARGQLTAAAKGPGLRGAYLFERANVERLARERAA